MSPRGIGVSRRQGHVDWQKLTKDHGLSWAACEATEGTSFIDSQFLPGLKPAGRTLLPSLRNRKRIRHVAH